MKEMEIDAILDNFEAVQAFVDEELERLECPMATQIQIDIAVEEVFVNIAHYAYNPEVGKATIRVEVIDDPLSIVMTFMDNGIPYDPLAKEDPDVTLPPEERKIGGLGVYMVKESMDDVKYEYRNGQNILTLRKSITEN
ncbi:MAG: ATP-binding protein [Lachnospiraceae bacterium]|nr:ATP-binding protein [Lachnospiraceae bacterium]